MECLSLLFVDPRAFKGIKPDFIYLMQLDQPLLLGGFDVKVQELDCPQGFVFKLNREVASLSVD